MRRNLIACSLAAALAASAGCYSDATVTAAPAYGYSADPELEAIGPDVQVVDDLDYPVFFSGGFYWMWDGGFWYRSPTWRSGWVGVAPVGVPFAVRGIRTPLAYSHWHGGFAHGVAYHPGYHAGYRGGSRPAYQPHVVARGGGSHGGGHR